MYTWHILEIHLTMLYKKNKCVILLVYYYGLLIYINIKHKSLLHAYNLKKNNFFDVINVEQFNVLWIIKLIQWYCISMIMCDFTKQIILVLLPKENISEYPNIFKLLLCAIANFRHFTYIYRLLLNETTPTDIQKQNCYTSLVKWSVCYCRRDSFLLI